MVYTVVLKLSRGGDTAMRVLGCEPVAYEAAPGTGVCFRSELWHRTERASAGTVKLALFFGRWLCHTARPARVTSRSQSCGQTYSDLPRSDTQSTFPYLPKMVGTS